MMWIPISLSAIALGIIAASVMSGLFDSKTLGGLIGMSVASWVLVTTLVLSTSTTTTQVAAFSHAQLDADRVMTQQMSVSFDPSMQAQMAQDSMLQRSANPAYVLALEEHIQQFDRMLGQVP